MDAVAVGFSCSVSLSQSRQSTVDSRQSTVKKNRTEEKRREEKRREREREKTRSLGAWMRRSAARRAVDCRLSTVDQAAEGGAV
jgi:hypothetical protein